jgi:hypothetical protein
MGMWYTTPPPPTVKAKLIANHLSKLWMWADNFGKQPKLQNMDMRFGTWNVVRFYKACSILIGLKEFSKCKLDFLGI